METLISHVILDGDNVDRNPYRIPAFNPNPPPLSSFI
jgi:hypothetical protein